MKLGLGTAWLDVAEAFLDVLAPRVRGGLNIIGGSRRPERTAQKARALGIPLGTLEQLRAARSGY